MSSFNTSLDHQQTEGPWREHQASVAGSMNNVTRIPEFIKRPEIYDELVSVKGTDSDFYTPEILASEDPAVQQRVAQHRQVRQDPVAPDDPDLEEARKNADNWRAFSANMNETVGKQVWWERTKKEPVIDEDTGAVDGVMAKQVIMDILMKHSNEFVDWLDFAEDDIDLSYYGEIADDVIETLILSRDSNPTEPWHEAIQRIMQNISVNEDTAWRPETNFAWGDITNTTGFPNLGEVTRKSMNRIADALFGWGETAAKKGQKTLEGLSKIQSDEDAMRAAEQFYNIVQDTGKPKLSHSDSILYELGKADTIRSLTTWFLKAGTEEGYILKDEDGKFIIDSSHESSGTLLTFILQAKDMGVIKNADDINESLKELAMLSLEITESHIPRLEYELMEARSPLRHYQNEVTLLFKEEIDSNINSYEEVVSLINEVNANQEKYPSALSLRILKLYVQSHEDFSFLLEAEKDNSVYDENRLARKRNRARPRGESKSDGPIKHVGMFYMFESEVSTWRGGGAQWEEEMHSNHEELFSLLTNQYIQNETEPPTWAEYNENIYIEAGRKAVLNFDSADFDPMFVLNLTQVMLDMASQNPTVEEPKIIAQLREGLLGGMETLNRRDLWDIETPPNPAKTTMRLNAMKAMTTLGSIMNYTTHKQGDIREFLKLEHKEFSSLQIFLQMAKTHGFDPYALPGTYDLTKQEDVDTVLGYWTGMKEHMAIIGSTLADVLSGKTPLKSSRIAAELFGPDNFTQSMFSGDTLVELEEWAGVEKGSTGARLNNTDKFIDNLNKLGITLPDEIEKRREMLELIMGDFRFETMEKYRGKDKLQNLLTVDRPELGIMAMFSILTRDRGMARETEDLANLLQTTNIRANLNVVDFFGLLNHSTQWQGLTLISSNDGGFITAEEHEAGLARTAGLRQHDGETHPAAMGRVWAEGARNHGDYMEWVSSPNTLGALEANFLIEGDTPTSAYWQVFSQKVAPNENIEEATVIWNKMIKRHIKETIEDYSLFFGDKEAYKGWGDRFGAGSRPGNLTLHMEVFRRLFEEVDAKKKGDSTDKQLMHLRGMYEATMGARQMTVDERGRAVIDPKASVIEEYARQDLLVGQWEGPGGTMTINPEGFHRSPGRYSWTPPEGEGHYSPEWIDHFEGNEEVGKVQGGHDPYMFRQTYSDPSFAPGRGVDVTAESFVYDIQSEISPVKDENGKIIAIKTPHGLMHKKFRGDGIPDDAMVLTNEDGTTRIPRIFIFRNASIVAYPAGTISRDSPFGSQETRTEMRITNLPYVDGTQEPPLLIPVPFKMGTAESLLHYENPQDFGFWGPPSVKPSHDDDSTWTRFLNTIGGAGLLK